MADTIQHSNPSGDLPQYRTNETTDTKMAGHARDEKHMDAQLSKDDALLASLGYKAELKREFTRLEVFGLAFSIIGLLPSIASTLVFSMPAGGPIGMVWGWVVAGCLILLVGLAMAELASSMPTSGGLYWWSHRLAAPQFRRCLCFVVGYLNTLGIVGGVCSINWGGALMLTSAVSISKDGEWTASTGQVYAVFLGIHVIQGFLGSSVTRVLARLQNVFVFANFAIIIATFAALPATTPSDQRNSAEYIFGGWNNTSGWVDGFAFIVAWLSPVWSIGGFDSCVHISEEASNASTAVPFAIVGAISCAGLFGWLCVIVIVACMGTDINYHLASPYGQPMASVYALRLGKQGTLAIWTLMFVIQFGMGQSITLSCSRQMWAFSRDNALPMSRYLKRVTKKAVPVYAVWAALTCSCVLGLLALINTASAQAVFAIAVLGTYSAYGAPIFARLVWGGDNFKPGPFYLGRFSKPVSWAAICYMTFMIIILCFPGTPSPTADTMNYGAVVFVAVIVGALAYYFFPKYGARHWFTGPVHTLQEGITPEMVAYVQHEYEEADRERKAAHPHTGLFHHEHRGNVHAEQ